MKQKNYREGNDQDSHMNIDLHEPQESSDNVNGDIDLNKLLHHNMEKIRRDIKFTKPMFDYEIRTLKGKSRNVS